MEDVGSFLLRVALGGLFLMGAWGSVKDAAARTFTKAETALVFNSHPALFAYAGILIMGVGGLSVLLGVFPRVGALALAVFLVPGAFIHFAKRGQAVGYKRAIVPSLSGTSNASSRKALDALTSSAAIGHFTAGLKNFALLGPALYLVFAGAREPMLIGYGPGWHLQGLLTRL